MPVLRTTKLYAVQFALAAGVACALPHLAAGQTLSGECAKRWAAFEAAANGGNLEVAVGAEKELAGTSRCNDPRVKAKGVMLGLYRTKVAGLEKAGASPATRLAALNAALEYGSNAWDIHAKIGDLKKSLPGPAGEKDYAGAAVAYVAAVEAIEAVPATARPTSAETRRIVALAREYRTLSPTYVSGRALYRDVARQVDVERVQVPLQFVFDSDQMTDRGREEAEEMFKALSEKMPRIDLIGHTDPDGTDVHNDDLSVRRANAVKTFLTKRNYPADRITIEGRGKREADKFRIEDRTQYSKDQIHQILRRVELVWK